MATATKTWSFASDTESWAGTAAGTTVLSWQSADGSPANGCLQMRLTGKNNNPGESYWEISGTWASLFGIPAGAVVTEVGTAPNHKYNWRCSEFATGLGTNQTGPFELWDNTPTLQGTFSSAQTFTGTTSFATLSGAAISVPSAMQDSGTTIRLRLKGTLRTGNSSSAAITLRQDEIVLTITYTADVSVAVTGSEAISSAGNVTATVPGGDIKIYKGSFTKNAGTPPFDQAVTGVGFTPKLIMFWVGGSTDGFEVQGKFGFSATSGVSNSFGIAINSNDNVATTATARASRASICLTCNTAGGYVDYADLKTFDADGFTVTWQLGTGAGRIFHFIALGGADFTGAVNTHNMSTLTGNQGYTGVGFQPDALILFSAMVTATPTVTSRALFCLGAASSTTSRWTMAQISRSGQTTTATVDAEKTQITTGILTGYQETGSPAQDFLFDLASLDADGFTLNQSDAPASAYKMFSVSLKGGLYKAGNFLKTTGAAPASQSVTSATFPPLGVLLGSFVNPASGSSVPDCEMVLGGADGTREGCVWSQVLDVTLNTEANCSSSTAKVLQMNTGPSTVDAEADLTSLDSNGFTLNWTTNDSADNQIVFFAFGAPAGGGDAVVDVDGTLIVTTSIGTSGVVIGPKFFESGFETGDLTEWSGSVTSGGTSSQAVNTVRPHLGTYSNEFHYALDSSAPEHRDTNVYVYELVSPSLDHIFVRSYFYLKTPEPGGNIDGIQRKLMRFLDNANPDFPNSTWNGVLTTDTGGSLPPGTLSMRYQVGGFGTGDPPTTSYWDLFLPFPLDTWTAVEFELQLNTPGSSDGQFRLYINGNLEHEQLNVNLRGTHSTGVARIHVGEQADRINFLVVDEYRYIDSVAFSTNFIGTTSGTDVQVNPTGVALAATDGSISDITDASFTQTGEALTPAVGDPSITVDASFTQTGEAAASSVGTVNVLADGNVQVDPTGEAATTAVGNVSITLDADVAVTGVALGADVGGVAVTGTSAPAGSYFSRPGHGDLRKRREE